MEKEHSYRSRSIQKKLMAATSMLLVATIMLVSSTYAWFTLSTAPEVTGITTTVGANGSLEIALADSTTWSSPDTLVSSAVGSSSAATTLDKANITWGNLVDLSLESYGLDKITLLPSRADISDAGVLAEVPLKTPVYGADGRVSELAPNTLIAAYDGSKFVIDAKDANGVAKYGVRAIGTSSGMSERQLAYRDARNAVSAEITNATSAARKALATNGNKLADIIINKALNDSDVVTKEQLQALGALLDGLKASLDSISAAFDQALLAKLASADMQDDLSDLGFSLVSAYIGNTIHATDAENGQLTVSKEVDGQTYSATVTLDQYLVKAIAMYKTTEATLNTAKTAYDELIKTNADSYSWDGVSDVMTPLVNYNGVLINDVPAKELMAGDTREEAVNKVVQSYKGTILVQMPSGTGLFANISDIAGTYSASITIEKVSVSSLNLTNINAAMETLHKDTLATEYPQIGDTSASEKAYLAKELIAIDGMGAPTAGEGSGDAGLTDTFGYMLDFYFRTNAAASSLRLQTDAINRVYSNADEASATQGGGSYMEFSTEVDGYPTSSMKALMAAIRVVFVDDARNVLANARLDMSEATENNGVVKAPLKLVDSVTEGTEESPAPTTSPDASASPAPSTSPEPSTSPAPTTSPEPSTSPDASASPAPTTSPSTETTTNVIFKNADKADIVSLTQNTAKKVTVLVYLDGDYVSNVNVANAAESMSGKLNLQFSSSADLVPMENAALRDMEVTATPSPNPSATADPSATVSPSPSPATP